MDNWICSLNLLLLIIDCFGLNVHLDVFLYQLDTHFSIAFVDSCYLQWLYLARVCVYLPNIKNTHDRYFLLEGLPSMVTDKGEVRHSS